MNFREKYQIKILIKKKNIFFILIQLFLIFEIILSL